MPSQPTIRDYFQPRATGSDNSDGAETDGPFDRLMQFVHQNIQRLDNSSRAGMAQIESLIQTAFTKMEEENRQIKVRMEDKLREAETSIAESRREVARLSAEIADLRNVVNQRPGQTDAVDGGEVVDVDRDMDIGVDGGGAGQQQHGLTQELLQSMINNHMREQDRYWRNSLMITAGTGTSHSDYRSWVQWLRSLGLYSLVEGAHSHYITGRGNLRLTYPAEIDMRRTLIQARKICMDKQLRCIHIEFLIPKRFVETKKMMMRMGREMKRDDIVSAYDVVMKESVPMLRTFKQTVGVKFWSLEELQNQGEGQEEDN